MSQERHDFGKGDIVKTTVYNDHSTPKYLEIDSVMKTVDYVEYKSEGLEKSIRVESIQHTTFIEKTIFRTLKLIRYY